MCFLQRNLFSQRDYYTRYFIAVDTRKTTMTTEKDVVHHSRRQRDNLLKKTVFLFSFNILTSLFVRDFARRRRSDVSRKRPKGCKSRESETERAEECRERCLFFHNFWLTFQPKVPLLSSSTKVLELRVRFLNPFNEKGRQKREMDHASRERILKILCLLFGSQEVNQLV